MILSFSPLIRSKNSFFKSSLILSLLCTCFLIGCSPKSTPTSTSKRFSLPQSVDLYGGADNLQNWLNQLQSYAQQASPQVPAFTLMVPLFLGQAFGLQNPQQVNLKAPIRWFAQLDSLSNSNPASAKKQKPPKLALAFKIKDPKTIKTQLNPLMWKPIEGQENQYNSINPTQPGQLYLYDQVVVLTNDSLFANEEIRQNLVTFIDEPFSQHFKVAAKAKKMWPKVKGFFQTAIDQQLKTASNSKKLNQQMQDMFDVYSVSKEISFTFEVLSNRLAFQVGLTVDTNHPLSKKWDQYHVDARSLFKGASPLTQGLFFIHPLNLDEYVLPFLKEMGEVPADFTLNSSSNNSVLFTVNEQLELNGLIQGKGPELHQAFKKLTDYFVPKFNQKAQAQYAVASEKWNDVPVEVLKMTKIPTDQGQKVPSLGDLKVQMSEVRTAYFPERVLMTFGPKSSTQLKKLHALSQNGQGGLYDRADFNELRPLLSKLSILFYLTPKSIHHLMSAWQNTSVPLSDQAQKFEQEGISIVAGQIDQEYLFQVNLPLETTKTLISPLIQIFTRGGMGLK